MRVEFANTGRGTVIISGIYRQDGSWASQADLEIEGWEFPSVEAAKAAIRVGRFRASRDDYWQSAAFLVA